jgi:uncharacterized protein with FMN-binding domain
MTVYAAGYLRTQTAAAKLQAAERNRVVIPVAAPDLHGGVASRAVEAPPAVATAPAVNPPAPPLRARSEAKKARAAETRPSTPSDQVSSPAAPQTTPEPISPATPTTTLIVEPQPTATPTPAPVAPVYKDGTYSGWGTSRHGDIQATVVIEGGRIASAFISQCLTRYSCSWVAHLQGQVVTRQSPEVDYVSGATQSTNAFYYAVVEALAKAK